MKKNIILAILLIIISYGCMSLEKVNTSGIIPASREKSTFKAGQLNRARTGEVIIGREIINSYPRFKAVSNFNITGFPEVREGSYWECREKLSENYVCTTNEWSSSKDQNIDYSLAITDNGVLHGGIVNKRASKLFKKIDDKSPIFARQKDKKYTMSCEMVYKGKFGNKIKVAYREGISGNGFVTECDEVFYNVSSKNNLFFIDKQINLQRITADEIVYSVKNNDLLASADSKFSLPYLVDEGKCLTFKEMQKITKEKAAKKIIE